MTALATDLTLSTAMREGSQAEHTAAENSGYLADLLGGRINSLGYTDYLLRLRPVYAELESVGRDLADHSAVAAVRDVALERLAAIDADLDHWADEGTRSTDSPTSRAYVERIAATRAQPHLFVAHHYTRYLGDLSGGQAIGRILDRSFELDGAGIAFYDFTAIPRPKPYKDDYRARLDALPLSSEEKVAVVEEVKAAFALNQALFEELGANLAAYAR